MAQPISLYLIAIKYADADVHHALRFNLEHSMTSDKGREIFRFVLLNFTDGYHFVVASRPKRLS